MVRVLSCHHFKSQKVGRCDGGVAVALADQVVIVAQEHLITIYTSQHISNISNWFVKTRAAESFCRGSLGGQFHFDPPSSSSSPAKERSPLFGRKKDIALESLSRSHSFPPVDLVDSITYNRKGHYLLSLERRESAADSFRVRVYFHWDRPLLKGRPMKARIAGLVSPTGGEVDSESLIMVEIPPEPLFATAATASCQLSANIVTLSTDGRVNVYTFCYKDSGGRGKLQYADFDLTVTLHVTPSSPTHIAFALNHIGTFNTDEVDIVKLKYLDAPSTSNEQPKAEKPVAPKSSQASEAPTIYNPKKMDLAQRLMLPTIRKENRRYNQPTGFTQELGDEIRFDKTTLVVPQSQAKNNRANVLGVEDVLRVRRDMQQGALIHLSLYAQRVGNDVGGTLCLFATETEMLIYHLPEVEGCAVKRITKCPFTGALQQLRFDSSFVHALTESGIETYSRRGLAEVLSDTEGFSTLNNDCPMLGDTPCLLGIRPFPGVRFVEANEHCLCLLSAPTQQSSLNEWTIYLLEAPPVDQFYEDSMRGAEAHRESSPEVYLTLLSELHLYLRDLMNRRPQDEPQLRQKYRDTTRLLGLQFIRNANTSTQEVLQEEMINRGIAFLQIGETDAKYFFRHENSDIPRDPQLVSGIAKYLRLTLPFCNAEEFPPSLSKAVVGFLTVNSIDDLARITVDTPWLREAQGQRILSALKGASAEFTSWRVSLALILVIVSVHGRDTEGVEEMNKVLKLADIPNLEKNVKLGWILEMRKGKGRLSDLAIVLAMTRTGIYTKVITYSLETTAVSLDDTVAVFHQAVNLTSDLTVKEALSRDLKRILESYFVQRLELNIEKEEEVRALNLLVSSYLPSIFQTPSKRNAVVAAAAGWTTVTEPFRKVPSYAHVLIDDDSSVSGVAKENFYALASLLASPLGNVKGIKDVVLRGVMTQSESTFGFPLRLLAESRDRAIDLLLSRRPELLLLYAKETFGVSVEGWKLVVMKVKEKVGTHPTNQDLITTVTESVYLHLANTLSPSALEEVLEKETEKEHFLDASKRVDLANAFADKVVQMSMAFLSRP